MYDRTTVQGATFDMRGQLYRGHANATALFSSPVHWAPSRTTQVLVLAETSCVGKNSLELLVKGEIVIYKYV